MALVECVPNFSEGRNDEVVQGIVGAMRAVQVKILDVRSDPDHNRTVVTMVGEPEVVSQAAFLGIKRAAELIDMDRHTGEHPRIGATDVVPFVPISGIGLEECVRLARSLGERVGRELGIPVYLYEAAATSPERMDLSDLRKGQYEGLKEAIRLDPTRKPDFGPSELRKAGATVIGAREFLIACNVYLSTGDVEKAKEIAKRVRQRGGGFPHVKAMGFQTRPYVQVSMNLTNFHVTPIHQVLEAIELEAKKLELDVLEAEIYGMVPGDALFDAAEHYLHLKGRWDRSQIIERRLMEMDTEKKLLRDSSVEGFLRSLASGSPTPGGGSAACVSGAMGAALGAMACRLTMGKKGYEDAWSLMEAKVLVFDELREKLTSVIDADARAYELVMEAFKLPKGTEGEKAARSKQVQEAYVGASQVPMLTAELCRATIDSLLEVAERCNKSVRTDVLVGLHSALTGLQGASANVLVNLAAIKDEDLRKLMSGRLRYVEEGAQELVERASSSISLPR